MAKKTLSIKWMTGTNNENKLIYVNVNALKAICQMDDNNFVIYMGGNEPLFLKDCTFSDDEPSFMET